MRLNERGGKMKRLYQHPTIEYIGVPLADLLLNSTDNGLYDESDVLWIRMKGICSDVSAIKNRISVQKNWREYGFFVGRSRRGFMNGLPVLGLFPFRLRRTVFFAP